MLYSLMPFFMALIFPILLLTVTLAISMHSSMDREKTSPFECGFDPVATARLPFSLRFFLLAVIFLVFDIEIVLLMPMIMLNPNLTAGLAALLFLLILIIGLFHEWNEGSLDWAD